jgi:hypothetical protein
MKAQISVAIVVSALSLTGCSSGNGDSTPPPSTLREECAAVIRAASAAQNKMNAAYTDDEENRLFLQVQARTEAYQDFVAFAAGRWPQVQDSDLKYVLRGVAEERNTQANFVALGSMCQLTMPKISPFNYSPAS